MSELNRSHPPSLRKTIKKTLKKECSIKTGAKILLGVSGGPDSMALLHALSTLQSDLNFHLYAVGVNHNLRPEAKDELKLAEDFSKSLLIPFFIKSIFLEPGGNIQERARVLRYKAFTEVKNIIEADYITTAHHAEDRAETVLMRIIRGTSVQGLNVLKPQSGEVLRPMIRARKRDVDLYIERKKIPFSTDSSNKNTNKYLRSKIRYEIMPALKDINPNITESLCELSNSSQYPFISGKREDRKIKLSKFL